MGIFEKLAIGVFVFAIVSKLIRFLFREKLIKMTPSNQVQHSVILSSNISLEDMEDVFALENSLDRILKTEGLGECDGNEVGLEGSDLSIFLYGPDAAKLFAAIAPHLQRSPIMSEGIAKLRFGDVMDKTAHEKIIEIAKWKPKNVH